MPIVRIGFYKGHTAEQKAACAREVISAVARTLGVPPKATQVIFVDVDKADWIVGSGERATRHHRMINLRHVEVFYAIMRAGSITEAARVLNVTQPAVSVALKQFEARLQMKLFDRVGGRLQPTPEAKALLPDIAEIFGRLGAVERFSQDLAEGTRGMLSRRTPPPVRRARGQGGGHLLSRCVPA